MNTSATQRTMYLTFFLCFLTALLEGFDLQAAGIAAPGMKGEFALTPPMMGWFFSLGLVGLLPGALVGGWLADRIGRRWILIASVVLFGIFSFATAHAWSYGSLLVARFFTGLGLGAALPILIALSSEAATPQLRATAVSLTYCGVPLGGMLAAILGATEYGTDWRLIFYIGGVVPVLIALALWLWLPESQEFKTQAAQGRAEQGNGLTALFNERRTTPTLLLWLACFFTLTVLYLLLNWLPTLLDGQGFSREQASIVQILFNVGGALGSLLSGRLMDKERYVTAVVVAYLGMLLALGGLGSNGGMTVMLIAGFAAGLCALAGQALLYALAPLLYPVNIRATGVGVSVAVGRLGSISGPLAAGQILAAGAGATGVLMAAAPGLVIASGAVLYLFSRRYSVIPAVPASSS